MFFLQFGRMVSKKMIYCIQEEKLLNTLGIQLNSGEMIANPRWLIDFINANESFRIDISPKEVQAHKWRKVYIDYQLDAVHNPQKFHRYCCVERKLLSFIETIWATNDVYVKMMNPGDKFLDIDHRITRKKFHTKILRGLQELSDKNLLIRIDTRELLEEMFYFKTRYVGYNVFFVGDDTVFYVGDQAIAVYSHNATMKNYMKMIALTNSLFLRKV